MTTSDPLALPPGSETLITRFLRLIDHRKRFLHPDPAGEGLDYWRERLIFAVLASGSVLSLLALGPSLYLAFAKRLWPLLVADGAAFLLLISLLVCRGIGLRAKAVALLLIAFTIGVVVILQVGFLSGGPAWLFAFSVLAGLLLGLRAAILATLMNFAAILLMGWLVSPALPLEREFLGSLSRTIAAWSNFAFLNAVVAISAAVLVDGLHSLNRKAVSTTERLTREIAERKIIAAELERSRDSAEAANRAKSEFLDNMGHELRTPLNHIIGFTQLVVDGNLGELNPTQREYLNDVLRSSDHLLGLINDILELTKVESGKTALSVSTVHLRPLVDDCLSMVRQQAIQKQIEMIQEISDGMESFQADERRLKHILYNLLSNAVKFTPEGGMIRVRAAPDSGDKGIRFSVFDSGVGLHPESRTRIFQPFEQADNSISRPFQGAGLGLALTKKLVDLHNGKIWVDSEGEGKGSAFHFVLPMLQEPPPGAQEK
jgi:signal transduction histidine kinase